MSRKLLISLSFLRQNVLYRIASSFPELSQRNCHFFALSCNAIKISFSLLIKKAGFLFQFYNDIVKVLKLIPTYFVVVKKHVKKDYIF